MIHRLKEKFLRGRTNSRTVSSTDIVSSKLSDSANRLFPFKILLGVCACMVLMSSAVLSAEKTLLILGDSLTAGYGIEKQEAFPQLLNNRLKDLGYGKIRVINGGFSGSTTASALQRMRWYMKLKPDIVILELGANDGLRGHKIESIRSNLVKTIQFAKDHKIVVVLAGMKLPVNYGDAYTRKFESLFKSLADEYSLPFIPFLLEGVAGNPSLNLADGIHPNPKGHKIVAENVLKHLHPLLNNLK